MRYLTLTNQRNLLYSILFILASLLVGTAQAQTSPLDLWIDVENNRSDRIKTYLNEGMDPNIVTNLGNPLLMQAVRDGAWDVFDVVLAHPDVQVGIMNGHQETPLMYVAIVGDLPRAKKLVEMGAEVNHLGWTPLHYAASRGHEDVVEYLLSLGAMPNAPAPDGSSPIMMAARTGSTTAAQMLLNAGADPTAVNINGEDAITAARDNGHSGLAEALAEVVKKRRAAERAD